MQACLLEATQSDWKLLDDLALKSVRQFLELRVLNMAGAFALTDSGMQFLRAFRNLTHLNVAACSLTVSIPRILPCHVF